MAGSRRNRTCGSCRSRSKLVEIVGGPGEAGPPQKEMVPSDLISSLALHRHARHGALRTKSAGRFASPLPDGCVSPAAGSMLPGSPLAASCPEPVARNGLSLARNGCRLSATSIPGSKLPACYFASFQIASVPVRPFGSTTAIPVCAGCGRFTAWGPLHFHYPVSACRAHRLHSPPGLLRPSGSKRSTAFAACRSA